MSLKSSRLRLFVLTGFTSAGMAFGIASAQAAFIGSTPGTNDVFGIREGWFDASLFLLAPGDVNATIELLGAEAAAINTFNINGGGAEYSSMEQAGTNPRSVVLSPGLLNFLFTTNLTNTSVLNGSNVSPATGLPNFFVTFGVQGDPSLNASSLDSGTVVLIAWDDSGSGPDDDYDDLVVRLTVTTGSITIVPIPVTLALSADDPQTDESTTVTAIPEPASFMLFGAGLLGLALGRRKT